MLQTAKATAIDLNDFANIWTIFDSGSQRAYVNKHVKEILNLKTLRTEKIILKTFGNEKNFCEAFWCSKSSTEWYEKKFLLLKR